MRYALPNGMAIAIDRKTSLDPSIDEFEFSLIDKNGTELATLASKLTEPADLNIGMLQEASKLSQAGVEAFWKKYVDLGKEITDEKVKKILPSVLASFGIQ